MKRRRRIRSQDKVPEEQWLKVTNNVAKNLDEFSYEWQNASTELLANQQSFKKWQKDIKKDETSKKWTAFSMIYAFVIAYVLSLIIYQGGMLLGIG